MDHDGYQGEFSTSLQCSDTYVWRRNFHTAFHPSSQHISLVLFYVAWAVSIPIIIKLTQ